MQPVFVIIGQALAVSLAPLVAEMKFAGDAIQALEVALKPVGDALTALKDSLNSLNPTGGGGGGGPHLNIGGVQLFDDGGIVGPDSGPMPAGLPGHRLVLAQLGEQMTPPGSAMAGAARSSASAQGAASAFHFHVQATDPHGSAQQIRQTIEELIVTRRLGVA
jgi:hypothetical protein